MSAVFSGSDFDRLHEQEFDEISALRAARKGLPFQERNFMGKSMLFVNNGERLLNEEGRLALCWERFLQRFLRSQHRSTLVLATREWPGWFGGERAFVVERVVPPLSPEAGALLLQQLGLADVPVEYLQQASEAVGGVPLCLEWVASLAQEPTWLDEWQESDALDESEEEGDAGQISTRRLMRLLKELSATSLLIAYPHSVQVLPMVASAVQTRLSAEQR